MLIRSPFIQYPDRNKFVPADMQRDKQFSFLFLLHIHIIQISKSNLKFVYQLLFLVVFADFKYRFHNCNIGEARLEVHMKVT